jgi:hypothetical protein
LKPEELTRLNRSRVSDIKQSYDIAILEAKIAAIGEAVGVMGWPAKVIELAAQRDVDVANEKKRLGML